MTGTTTSRIRTIVAMVIILVSVTTTRPNHTMATAYFVPGVNPRSYQEGDIVKLKVNKMTSTRSLFPIDYYHLPYCRPVDGAKMDDQNLGQFLAGDRIQSSPYLLRMKEEMYCEQLCISNLGRADQPGVTPNKFVKAIRNYEYHNNWIVDNLPSGSKVEDETSLRTQYWQGFPIGFVTEADHKAYVYNHVNIVIEYHPVEYANGYRIVRFTVEPFSIAHEVGELVNNFQDSNTMNENHLPIKAKIKNSIPSCDPKMAYQEHTGYDMIADSGVGAQPASGDILFTYDVIWKENRELQWASRWDIYLSMNHAIPAKVHWIPILISLAIILVMTAMLVCSFIEELKRNNIADDTEMLIDNSEAVQEVGWKAVHSDVFRPPSFSPMLLAVACGSGAQLLATTITTVTWSFFGFLNPSRRGHFILFLLWSYFIFGYINGYVTSRFYKSFDGKEQHRTTMTAAIGLPAVVFTVFMIGECIAIEKGSSYALPISALFMLVLLWAAISVPLVFLGAHWGFKQDVIGYLVSTSSIPREIPKRSCSRALPTITVGISGLLPMFICCVEWYYVMCSVWLGYYYNTFGFFWIVLWLVIVANAELSAFFTYYQLCKEDYQWWWRAFCNGGSVGIYIFFLSCLYYLQVIESKPIADFTLYVGFMGLVSLAIFTMMGFVGVTSSLYFNKALYATINANDDTI